MITAARCLLRERRNVQATRQNTSLPDKCLRESSGWNQQTPRQCCSRGSAFTHPRCNANWTSGIREGPSDRLGGPQWGACRSRLRTFMPRLRKRLRTESVAFGTLHPVSRRQADRRPANGRIGHMRLGIAHHYGWAVAVTSSTDFRVVDRRRIELIQPDLPAAPIHHEGGAHLLHRSGEPLDDSELEALVTNVRAAVVLAASTSLDEIVHSLDEPITMITLRAWPTDFPEDIATQRRVPYESRADSVMYCRVLAQLALERGWAIHTYNARSVEDEAVRILGDRANEVLRSPRARLGPPWSKDHRMALAATIVAS